MFSSYYLISTEEPMARLISNRLNSSVELGMGLALLGTVGVAVEKANLPAIDIVFWRSLFGAIFLSIWCIFTKTFPCRETFQIKNISLSFITGASLVLSWACFFYGIQNTSISTATIIFHTQPFIITIISAILFREKIHSFEVIWISIAFLGICLASGLTSNVSLSNPNAGMWGIIVCICGAILYAITAISGKSLKKQSGIITTLFQTICGIVIFLPFTNFSHHIPPTSWGWLVIIGIIHTGIAWVLIYSALPKVPTTTIAIMSFINPLTAILTDVFFFGHILTLIQIVGALSIAISTLGMRFKWLK